MMDDLLTCSHMYKTEMSTSTRGVRVKGKNYLTT